MTTDLEQLADKLRPLLDDPELHQPLTKSEVEAVREVIKIVDTLKAWGRLGKLALWILSAVAGGLLAWDTIASRLGQ